jgi:outer membrane protein assembly factor BamB
MKMLVLAVGIALVFASIGRSAEQPLAWPQFRGPDGSGVADGEKPPVEIGPAKNVKWKVPVPSGLSSPIVVGELLVITALEDGKLYTIAYNRADGSEAWRAHAPAKELEPYHKTEGSPAASTCATDGERIVSYFGSCGLFCYDLAGKELWHYEMPPAATVAGFGTGGSPVLADNTVVLVREETKDPKIVAVDLLTGDLKWEKKRQSRSAFSTPAIWDTAEGKQVAVPGFLKLIGYDLKTGEEAWFVEGMPSACCTTPVATPEDLFFAGWSPGDPSEETEYGMPKYDDLLKASDTNKDGVLAKDEVENTEMEDFFNAVDGNQDGKYTREEADEMDKFMAASRNSAFALKPGGSGNVTASHMRWKQTRGLPYVASAIVYKDQLVMVKDGGIVTAYNAKTGEKIYEKRAVASGGYYSSPVAANGYIYFASLPDGAITVLKGGASAPEVVAENEPLRERLAATPAIADDTLYVRTAGHLYAFVDQK